MKVYDGFWLPKQLKQALITPETTWNVEYRQKGKEASEGDPTAVGARWPDLSHSQWELLFRSLEDRRTIISTDFVSRMQEAVSGLNLGDVPNSFLGDALDDLANYTGYSPQMITFALNVMDLTPFDTLEKALSLRIPGLVHREFMSLQSMGGVEGRMRFYRQRNWGWPFVFRWVKDSGTISHKENYPQMVLGYAAGNVIGTAFLITFLAQVSALVSPSGVGVEQNRIPAILVKNSREETLFAPLLFDVLEEINPNLVSSTAVMIWDYEEESVQDQIVSKADLVLAAAGDYSIHQIDQVIKKVNPSARFHKHGHKVSFTTIGKSYLSRGKSVVGENASELFEILTLLAAVDSVVWDQNGCLSSRVHFIERGAEGDYSPIEYGENLVRKMRILSEKLPRGSIPLGRIHDRFEYFNAQTYSDQVHVCSSYEDDFIVVIDDRPWNLIQFRSMINQCMERSIVIRPVESIMDVPEIYLKWIDEKNLQTMYVSIDGEEHESWSKDFKAFVERVGECGVTGIRTVGQGPFPQLAYSWDGYLPQNFSISYPEGRFTTVEFENTFSQVMKNYALIAEMVL